MQGNGLKQDNESKEEVYSLKHLCGFDHGIENLKACVRNKTFTLEDTIWSNETQVSVYEDPQEYERVREYVNSSLWTSWMTTTMFGFCHTLVYPKPLEVQNILMVRIKGNFRVMLHDPTFFVLRYQNFYIPYTLLDNPNGKNYNLVVGTKRKMNRPGKFECNPDTSYNFEKCVRRSLANKIGCLSPWDPRPLGGEFKMCNLTSEVKRYLLTTFFHCFLK